MSKKKLQFFLLFLFPVMILSPEVIFKGAAKGLSLWFQTVLPTLMPFFILAEVMVDTGSFQMITSFLGPVLSKILGISPHAGFAVICGILCGCPSGAKCAVKLYEHGYISSHEVSYLLTFCNNFSPAFIVSYVFFRMLHMPDLAFVSLFICIIVPLLMSFLYRQLPFHRFRICPEPKKISPSHDCPHPMVSLEEAIINSFDLLIKIGGFLMIFSIIVEVIFSPMDTFPMARGMISPLIEVTSGISSLCSLTLPLSVKYPFVIFFLSFGGLCGAAQTAAVISKTSISVRIYTLEKLVSALATSLISFLYIKFIST